MKFSFTLIAATFATFVASAPTGNTSDATNGTLVPSEAIIGGLEIPSDVYPIFSYENDTAIIVFLNSTVLSETESKRSLEDENSLLKRSADAEAGWVRLKIGQPFFKRDAEADADADAEAGWVRLKIGQPFFKRSAEAEADAEADAEAGWVRLKIGQPFFKRDAEADAEAGWVRLKIGQPFFKRDAEADADAGWVRLKIGQPFF